MIITFPLSTCFDAPPRSPGRFQSRCMCEMYSIFMHTLSEHENSTMKSLPILGLSLRAQELTSLTVPVLLSHGTGSVWGISICNLAKRLEDYLAVPASVNTRGF